ncbi:N-alpha-acetyltransferase 80 [Macrosteles quadrilineatus]|uniref:N-alpha-acetyltransferase 80 n=1 Tax=Macrosteles quadrilineatus TaxID=74068 RepID=UPI0023E32786|nr:N-alpha-acetyltransferase 80 [Macrosteles quadrilineatus]
MDMECLEVLPLHQNDIYREECAKLINSEWKRSHTARIWSLKNSCDTFPTSLVMIYNKSEVVGHSKLSAIPSIPDACFVESVVIAKNHRGKGWGKYLMLATEEYAIRCGVQEIYLSAIDPVPAFYAKLGYLRCEPVSIYGGPTVSSPRASPTTVNGPSPPPPPLPCYKLDRNSLNKVAKVFMKKILYEVDL